MINSAQMATAYVKSAVLFVCVAIVLVGCKTHRVNLASPEQTFEPGDYSDVFDLWSREFQLVPLDGVQNVLTARGTYLSYEFRLAYIERVAHDFRLSPQERRDLENAEFKALDEHHEFFVTVMSGIPKSDDIDQDRGEWSIRLKDDKGRQSAPVEIRKIRKPTLREGKYFSFDKAQRTAYRIFFSRTGPDGQPILSGSTQFFTLSFSSALGQADMRWETTAMRGGE